MEETFGDMVLKKHYRRKDVEPKFGVKDHYEPSKIIADEKLRFGESQIRLRVTVYPPEVVRKRGNGR